jgi:hypothetical protein
MSDFLGLLGLPLSKQLQDAIVREIELLYPEQQVPPLLYHYTSPEGLSGIVSSGTLYMTNASFLNDSTEIQYGVGIVREAVDSFGEGKSNPEIANFRTMIKASIQAIFRSIFDVYVTCFSEDDNSLSQWRAYAKQGYSIAFSTAQLESVFTSSQRFTPILRKVEYDKDTVLARIQKLFEIAYRFSSDLQQSGAEASGSLNLITILINHLIVLVPSAKDPSFSTEHEWRLIKPLGLHVADERNQVEFRSGPMGLVPYVRMHAQDSKLPIAGIRYGPSSFPDLSRKALELIAKRHGYGDAKIDGANIPLRAYEPIKDIGNKTF